ncbi:hypothetical protein LCI18_011605 [Fusarium solani-melongenae]|uniref:Uncharacterized protein n=1 Tax=Fusarium solani subsp. cucurbitae TaxID=2747967 RepID=A0ACD3ZHG0_FUSSC|nr:hypothetical protein LCI18_011605 [Fusarium solani-melongenae]
MYRSRTLLVSIPHSSDSTNSLRLTLCAEQTMSTATQLTPSRATQLAQASSPNTPFGISSDSEGSGSDFCEIQQVQPSPNRKRNLPAADQRVQPSKKAKTKQTPPETSASVNKKPISQASGPSRAPAQPSSSAIAPNRSSSVSSKAKPAVNAKILPQPDNSSDCFIEKVLPSPKRHQQTQPQPIKRRRIDRAGNASTLVSEENRQSGQDSECEIVHIKPSPNRLSFTMLTSTDSDADDERPADGKPQVPRKIATPRKRRALPPKPADNCPAMKEPAATPSPVSSRVDQSIVIDLSQLVTSDSDSSAVETSHSTAQATQPLPAQGEPTTQSNQPEQSATNHSTATEPAPSPENSQSQHRLDPESDDITGKLMDYLDSQLEAMKEKETSPSSDDNDPFSPASEHPPKIEPQEDSPPIKKEIDSGAESSDDDYDYDEQDEDEDEDEDEDDLDEDSLALVKMEDGADSDSSELFMSSPPVSYQHPPTEEDSPKPVKREPDTEAEGESDAGDFNETLNTSVSSFNERLAASYKLQPVYSGDKLSETNEPDTPGSFQPHHRDSLIGLKSILKRPKTSPARASGDDTEYASSPSVSPPSRSRRASPSPTERIQGSKKQAKALRPSPRESPASKLATVASVVKKQVPSKLFVRARSWLPPRPNVTKRAKTPSPKRPRGWRLQRKQLTPLVPIPPASLEHDSDDSTSSQETPSKPPAKRPSATVQQPTQAVTHHETSNNEASGDERKTTSDKTQRKATKKKQLKSITHSSLVKPFREIKPAIIRDGVSEHAIKPTVARFEKKMAEGKGFTYNKTDSSNLKYNWEVDWSTPLPQTERTSRALAAELEERGIKTDCQYANFWYNLTMKYSNLAGSPVPLFTAKKKALEDVVGEALQNEKRRKRKARKAEKKKQPQGVEALLLGGADETDEESKSDESVDMEALVTKMKADEKKQRMLTGVGTSCGYLKK